MDIIPDGAGRGYSIIRVLQLDRKVQVKEAPRRFTGTDLMQLQLVRFHIARDSINIKYKIKNKKRTIRAKVVEYR